MVALCARYHPVAEGSSANAALHSALHDDSGPLSALLLLGRRILGLRAGGGEQCYRRDGQQPG